MRSTTLYGLILVASSLVTLTIATQGPMCGDLHLLLPLNLQWTLYALVGPGFLGRRDWLTSLKLGLIGIPISALIWGKVYWPQSKVMGVPAYEYKGFWTQHMTDGAVSFAQGAIVFALLGMVIYSVFRIFRNRRDLGSRGRA